MTDGYKVLLFLLAFLGAEAILIAYIDLPVSVCLRNIDAQSPWLIDIFRFYTDMGKAQWYLWPSGLGVLIIASIMRFGRLTYMTRERLRQSGERLLFLFLCVAASGIIADITKPIIGRARPVLFERGGFYGAHPLNPHALWNSMPSGHATTVFTVCLVLTKLYPQGRWLWALSGFILAASRIMVNAHYVSDVVGGAAVACITMYAFGHILDKYGTSLARHRLFPLNSKNT